MAYGGRYGTKSHSFVKALIILAMDRPLRILCAREYQNSLADSAYKLFCDHIRLNNLEGFFEIMHDSIRCANGGEIRFMGIMTNTTKIKSFEGVDICYIMEAAKISQAAMQILTPTIRKPGSEIWIEFNPESSEDYIYRVFVLAKVKPPRSIVVEINFFDLPADWLSQEIMEEIAHMKATDMDEYLHVYCGKPKRILTGAVYAEEIRLALVQNRIGAVPWIPTLPVYTFWDLGWADRTAIWFVQKVGLNYHHIDYLSARHKPMRWYFQQLQQREYNYGLTWLPHDAEHTDLGTGLSITELVRKAGYKTRIVPKLRVLDGINACRETFPRCYFDEAATKPGVDALCNYHWNDNAQSSRKPVHDEWSHGADGFRSFGVAIDRGVRILAGEDVDENDDKGLGALRRPQVSALGAAAPGDAWMR